MTFFFDKEICKPTLFNRKRQKIPFIDEDLDPFTGEWIAKGELEKMKDPPGGADRGKDNNHSLFCDLIISGLVGIRPRTDEKIEIAPLFEADDIEFLCADGIKYHGHFISVVWDKNGDRYNVGSGLSVFVDGVKRVAHRDIKKIIIEL